MEPARRTDSHVNRRLTASAQVRIATPGVTTPARVPTSRRSPTWKEPAVNSRLISPGSIVAGAALAALLMLARTGAVSADEQGIPFWYSGQYASLSAIPATPGWSANIVPFFYSIGSGNSSKEFQRGGVLATRLSADIAALIVQPTWAPATKVLGGQPSFGLSFGAGMTSVSGTLSVQTSTGAPLSGTRTDSVTGALDLYPIVNLAWAHGNHNWMTYLTGDIPVGAYDMSRFANLGIGHGAIDGGGGYTYLNLQNGREFTAVVGVTYNFENPDTHYRSGVDSHLDWALSQFLSETWHVGIVGYAYYQLSADSYPTTGVAGEIRSRVLGEYKSQVYSVGGEVGHLFKLGNQDAYFNLRGYSEFSSTNRLKGYALWALVNIPIVRY